MHYQTQTWVDLIFYLSQSDPVMAAQFDMCEALCYSICFSVGLSRTLGGLVQRVSSKGRGEMIARDTR